MSVSATDTVPDITLDRVLESYRAILLDAYGVLVSDTGVLDGAAELLDRLQAQQRQWYVVTNDASKLPETTYERFAGMGLHIPADQIVTSGGLLKRWAQRRGYVGARALVLGPPDSQTYARRAGLEPVPVAADAEFEVLIIGDEAGFDFVRGMDDTLSALLIALDRGQEIAMVCPNPDLIYPKAARSVGLTSGAMAALIESVLLQRYPQAPPVFERLGKPNAPIFEDVVERAGHRDMVMLGDQLATDIAGARRFGLDAVLVGTGLNSRASIAAAPVAIRPTYYMDSL